jgi:hypothetical protein
MSQYSDIDEETTPKANKEHKCCECQGIITKGENYHLLKGLWDGSWYNFKTCADCKILKKEICSTIKDQYDHPAMEQLYQSIFDEPDNLPLITKYMNIRRKRKAPQSYRGWMEKKEILADCPSQNTQPTTP